MIRRPPRSTLFPLHDALPIYTNYALRKNGQQEITPIHPALEEPLKDILGTTYGLIVYQEQVMAIAQKLAGYTLRSEEHTSELQSRQYLVCRLLLEKKKTYTHP